MSFHTADILHEPDWGLPDEYISKIIAIEKMKEITEHFNDLIKPLLSAFGNVSKIRIAAFNEKSGCDQLSNAAFKAFADSERYAMYVNSMSNKQCCVLFVHDPNGIHCIESMPGVLAHEYAHHFQLAHAGFPLYYRETKHNYPEGASFVKYSEIGSLVKKGWIDNMLLPEPMSAIEDSLERISDIICEGILRERKIPSALEDIYTTDVTGPDPPLLIQTEAFKRYVHRLSLCDFAEWAALITLKNPKIASAFLQIGKERVCSLNKKYLDANRVYDLIFKACIETDYNQFRGRNPTIEYMQKIFDVLNIKLIPPLS